MKEVIYINKDKRNVPITLQELYALGIITDAGDIGDIDK